VGKSIPRAAVGGALVLALAGCTEDVPDVTADSPPPVVEVAQPPVFDVPTDEPVPTEVTYSDLVEGAGPAPEAGDQVRVHFVAKSWTTGDVVEQTWGRAPFQYTVGETSEVAGWQPALDGMRVGGRRRVVIPAEFAYGDRAFGAVRAGDALVFVVDLVEIVEP
jgi:peptidylprolyl isomerase